MFARVSTYDVPEDRTDETTAAFSSALDQIAEARGFEEGLFLLGRESGRGIAITFWSDEDAMAASRVAASRLRSTAIESVGGEILSSEEFRIAVRTAPAAAL